MLKRIAYQLFICLLVFASCKKDIIPDETQSDTFVKLFGGSSVDAPRDMLLDGENMLVTGTMKSPNNGTQAFLIGTDKNGNELPWSPLLVGDIRSDEGNKVFKTRGGDFILVGTQQTAESKKDLLVSKISPNGQVVWTQTYGGSDNEEGYFGLELSSGGYVVGGYTESYGNGYKDIYIVRLDEEGNIIWQSTIGFGSNETGYDIVEEGGLLYILGSTESFNPIKSMFIVQAYISTGRGYNFRNFVQPSAYSGSKICVIPGNKMVLLATGNASTYMACVSYDLSDTYWETTSDKEINTVSFNNNSLYFFGEATTLNNSDILIQQYDLNGVYMKSSQIKSEGNQQAVAGFVFSDGKVCLAGTNIVNSISQILLIKKTF